MTKIYSQASKICGIIKSVVGKPAESAHYSDLYVLANIIALCV